MFRDTERRVLVVGAGCFGISTASHLLERGYKHVTVIDRADILPAPDAASTDMNKVVRSSYTDRFYTELCRDAIHAWKNTDDWGEAYHESGVVMLGRKDNKTDASAYTDTAYQNDLSVGARVSPLEHSQALQSAFPDAVRPHLAPFDNCSGFLNRDGGWAEAANGVSRMMARVVAAGGKVVPGKAATSLIKNDEGRTTGVQCLDGTAFAADLVVLALGPWTASTFPELELDQRCLATGQSVAMIQLSPEEGELYRNCPIVLNFGEGFYVFPPTSKNIMKMALHTPGHTNMTYNPTAGRAISTPRTIISHPDTQDGLRIPASVLRDLRAHLRQVYPKLAEKPFVQTRLCWYTDSPDGDWVIGYNPGDPALVLATAGSGHAFKFLPVIGRLVVDIIEGLSDPAVTSKFAVDRDHKHVDLSRFNGYEQAQLDPAELCTPGDLLP